MLLAVDPEWSKEEEQFNTHWKWFMFASMKQIIAYKLHGYRLDSLERNQEKINSAPGMLINEKTNWKSQPFRFIFNDKPYCLRRVTGFQIFADSPIGNIFKVMSYLNKELRELIKSDAKIFDFVQETSFDGLWFWDLENPENEWRNPKFWTTLGYTPDEIQPIPLIIQTIINKDDLKKATDNFIKHCENSNLPYDQVIRYTHKNGSTVWSRCRGIAIRNKSGKAIRMLVTHTDITKEKENEEKLRIQNSILQSSIESHKDVLIFSINRTYQYLIFNNAFKLATFQAYGVEITTGMSMLDSITDREDRKKAKDNCDRALAGENHVTVEVYGKLIRHYFETRYNPIIDDKGEVIGVTILSTDITERKRFEDQLQQLNIELESFSYSISHDLRAPLKSISNYATLLQNELSGTITVEAKKMIDSISRNSKKMGNLIDDLLAFSRLGRKEIARLNVDMNTLVKNVLDEFYAKDSDHKTILDIRELSSSSGDPVLLKQVWINLISNAIKYSGKKPAPKIEISCVENEKEVTYCIKDNGAGFDMDYYKKLFGVFQRLHREDDFEGTGVGLAIVKKIINRHGGNVWAEAKINKGATFFFTLPKFDSDMNKLH